MHVDVWTLTYYLLCILTLNRHGFLDSFPLEIILSAVASICYNLPSSRSRFRWRTNFNEGYLPRYSHQPALYGTDPLLPPSDITVANEQQRHFVDESLIHNVCNLYRSELGFPDFSVDVLFVDPEEMTKYNILHFGKRKPTDIISLADNSTYVRDQYHLNRSPQQVPEFRHLGEIIVCPNYLADEMRRDLEDCKGRADSHASLLNQQSNSGPFGVAVRMKKLTDLNLRFCYILAHGFLHLLGYDHVDDTDFERMLLEEDRLLDIFERFHASNSQTKLR